MDLSTGAPVSQVTLNIMKKRVLHLKDDGKQETPLEAYTRAAIHVGQGHSRYNTTEETRKFINKSVEMMAEGKFMPNTPTLVNAGMPNAQCSACFVLPIEDNLPSIYKAHHNQGLIQASGGGTGFFLGNIRSTGLPADGGKVKTRGPLNWLKMLNEDATHVAQGMREGANMAILNIGHPDIVDFITCKRAGHKASIDDIKYLFGVEDYEAARMKAVAGIEKFNISVSVPDRFMLALERGDDWYFIDPHTKERAGSMPAQELWELIVQNAWENGEPGLFFEDTVNRYNKIPQVGRIQTTNPCGEQPLLPYESCTLGHVNLRQFVTGINGSSAINYEALEDTIRFGVEFLDNVVEVNEFPIPELAEMNHNTRRIGLGVMGWADMLALMGIPYDSEQAIEKAEEVGEFFDQTARDHSQKLGKDRGNFPYFEGSLYEGKVENMRNSDVTTIAPTGQTAMYAGGCSASIEPIIFPVIKRRQAEMEQIDYHPVLFEILKERGLDTPELREEFGKTGSVRKVSSLPDDIKSYLPVSHDIHHSWHVKHQIVWQKYITSAVSKTINFHENAKPGDIAEAYIQAYKGGCKGITVYRDNSRSDQPLSSLANKRTELVQIGKRSDVTHGSNRKIPNGCGNLMVYIGNGEDGRVQEITARLGKGGGCASAQTEAIARMASVAMQNGVPAKTIASQLSGIRCHLTAIHRPPNMASGDKPRIVHSCGDAISVALSEHINNGSGEDKIVTEVNMHAGACPECSEPLAHEEGCAKCYSCGFSRC